MHHSITATSGPTWAHPLFEDFGMLVNLVALDIMHFGGLSARSSFKESIFGEARF